MFKCLNAHAAFHTIVLISSYFGKEVKICVNTFADE